MPVLYADASAVVKLVLDEPESAPLRLFLGADAPVSSEIVVTELLRALTRAADVAPGAEHETLRRRAFDVLDALVLVPLEWELLVAASSLPEPSLRALDALHVAAALSIDGLDRFVTYDVRQAAAARIAGLRTVSPGA